MPYGKEFLSQDIEKGLEKLHATKEACFYFDSFFPHVRMLSAKIVVDGEFLGAVFSYPYITDQVTSKEIKEIEEAIEVWEMTPDRASYLWKCYGENERELYPDKSKDDIRESFEVEIEMLTGERSIGSLSEEQYNEFLAVL